MTYGRQKGGKQSKKPSQIDLSMVCNITEQSLAELDQNIRLKTALPIRKSKRATKAQTAEALMSDI